MAKIIVHLPKSKAQEKNNNIVNNEKYLQKKLTKVKCICEAVPLKLFFSEKSTRNS